MPPEPMRSMSVSRSESWEGGAAMPRGGGAAKVGERSSTLASRFGATTPRLWGRKSVCQRQKCKFPQIFGGPGVSNAFRDGRSRILDPHPGDMPHAEADYSLRGRPKTLAPGATDLVTHTFPPMIAPAPMTVSPPRMVAPE